MISLDDLLLELINPPGKEGLRKFLKSKEDKKAELRRKADKGILVKDFIKTTMWQMIQRPKVVSSLKEGFGKILRDGLTMNEIELKNTISAMRANIENLGEMKYLVEEGERASIELSKMEVHS